MASHGSGTIDYGIDLGTTNSAIVRFDGSEMRIFKNRDQMDVTPSVVQIDRAGRIIVGRRAYNSLLADPDNVASEFKRWMGQSDRKRFAASGKEYTAEELSAEVLKSLTDDVMRQTGEPVRGAVITVPAAFGQLQCEATARAARLAGLEDVVLIQEPVAASIAYGMKPESHEKRFLVYDLGGGTFDVAVVSMRDGQLSVLDHCGNNMLGGKDFDRMIVRKILLPRLRESFALDGGEVQGGRRLLQALQRKAEEAKIDLSFAQQAIVSIFDVGADDEGREIEAELTVTRAELGAIVEPLIAETISLCRQAMQGGRVSAEDISAVVLVGGPTQMPVVREALSSAFNVPLDFTIDPMTVVARGAAIYASTSPRSSTTQVAVESLPSEETTNVVKLQLAYEPVWPDTTSLVAGRVESAENGALEVFIAAESGHWNSGWLPLRDGYFETMVHIPEGRSERFTISLRGPLGERLVAEPDSFAIRHGLALSEPPLPHSIGAEVSRAGGEVELDIIFPRSTPLPAQKVITYKASRTIRPDSGEECIAIKLWEGEYPDPEGNTFVGALQILSEHIKRPIREGAEIELTISIDTSRRMEVHAFVPSLGQHFQERVYVAQENDPNLLARMEGLDEDILECRERLGVLEQTARSNASPETMAALKEVRLQIDDLWVEYDELKGGGFNEPDDARKIYQKYRLVKGRLALLKRKIAPTSPFDRAAAKLKEERAETLLAVAQYGSAYDKKESEDLCRQADEQMERGNTAALERLTNELRHLRARLYMAQDDFWEDWFHSMSSPYCPFLNRTEAEKHLATGRQALEAGDKQKLRESVRHLWRLLPDTEETEEEKRALDAGIRK